MTSHKPQSTIRNPKSVVIGLGEVLWDLFPEGKQFGGAPANFAYHAKCLGAEGFVVSAVGNDELGREILDRLDALGLNRQFVAVDEAHPTGTVSVELDGAGKPRYVIHENVAWDSIPAMPGLMELAQKADAVCFGSLAQRAAGSRKTIRDFLGATQEGCLRILDINLRQRFYDAKTVIRSLELANVLKLNDEELPVLTRLLKISGGEDDVMDALRDRYDLRVIALTKGAHGSVLIGPDGRSVHAGVAAKVVDTVGAGDAFTAALAVGLLRGLDLDDINDHANHVAAYVCSRPGATPEMPARLTRLLG